MARRWPSNTDVSQERSLSIKAAQIFAAAAASLERACDQPQLHAEPVIAFFHDNDRPQRSDCRGVGFEQGPPQRAQAVDRVCAPEVDAEFGSLHGDFSRRFRCCRFGAAGAAASGAGNAVMTAGGCSGSISFAAAGSGGAIIDRDATSGVAGVAAGAFAFVSDGPGATDSG